MLASKYFVKVADASCAYAKGTTAETVEPLIVVTSAMDAITPVFAPPRQTPAVEPSSNYSDDQCSQPECSRVRPRYYTLP